VTAPATSEVFNELKRMRDTQMTPAELLLSKDSIARSLPGRFERGTDAAATFAETFHLRYAAELFFDAAGTHQCRDH